MHLAEEASVEGESYVYISVDCVGLTGWFYR